MRALARWGITPLLAAPLGAWALGLGDIELQSALNQPFKAQIALSATPEELQALRVSLATPDAFQRYGLDRPAFLSALEFRVVGNRDGRSIIEVTSRESIAEPFVTLLVEATWPRGRTLREYTVLLDPPVLLPAPAAPPAVRPAETRAPAPSTSGGPINRPAAPAPTPAPRVEPAPGPVSSSPPPAPRVPAVASGGSYGPVQRAETLWAIADRFRPEGVSVNQMMIAIYRANPEAFRGNINVLRAGSTLQLPEAAEFNSLTTAVANAEVRRQTDEWLNRPTQGGQLRLLPPAEQEVARAPAPAPAPARPATPAPAPGAAAPPGAAAGGAATAANAPTNRPLEVNNSTLQNLQQQANAPAAAPAPAESPAEPGVDLETEGDQVFADESPAEPAAAEQPAPAPAAAPAPAPAASNEASMISRVTSFLLSPLLLIGVGVAVLLGVGGLLFMRRRRQEAADEPEDVTGRWDALESEVEDDEVREATERMRRQVPADESIVVEESERPRRAPEADEPAPRRAAPAAKAAKPAAAVAAATADETLSSQTVINLDSADAVAEADFHMAYGLYDQAAELVQKALDAAPNRRDLKLKLLEVFFVWGNKDAFLKAAQSLRKEIGQGTDADWDKVVIMGRQICPDERLFTEATTAGGSVDVDLEAGDSPLDLAFDDASAGGEMPDVGLDFDVAATADDLPVQKPAAKPKAPSRDFAEDSLDIGERTAAGLEAALFEAQEQEADDNDDGRQTMPDVAADDSAAITQESPTIERSVGGREWATVDAPTMQLSADAPTVETPTIETAAADAPTMETPTVETAYRRAEPPTVEQPALGASDYTAEIDLDDLGLDVEDLEGLPSDLGDLPTAAGRESDTREQPALVIDDPLLSATGVTKVLQAADDGDADAEEEFEQRKTSVLDDEEATLLAPGFGDGTLTGTEVLEGRFESDESGDTSLVKSLKGGDGLDLDLADLTAALHGADTVEQPRASAFSRDVFGGGDTPLDLDVGGEANLSDDAPTGTEEVSPLDPQTMTEVGTKLDLARAYIDMGDPEGARSILEEVLDEGDPNQRREAQSLIDVLSA